MNLFTTSISGALEEESFSHKIQLHAQSPKIEKDEEGFFAFIVDPKIKGSQKGCLWHQLLVLPHNESTGFFIHFNFWLCACN